MTYDFFYQHASKYLTDNGCQKLWDARPAHIDQEPESDLTGEALEAMCRIHCRVLPTDAKEAA